MVATGIRFVKMLVFVVVNTCQALLADQLESSGMATGFGKLADQLKSSGMVTGFGKLSIKKHPQNLRSYPIYIEMQNIVNPSFSFLDES